MHPTPVFHWSDREAMFAFVTERAFSTIAATIAGEIVFAQAPVIVEPGRAGAHTGAGATGAGATGADRLLFHLSRANPIAKALPLRARLLVGGADGYVSPDWYGEEDQVPTWNYVSVELAGELVVVEDVADIVRRQSEVFEGRISGKQPWTPDKMTPAVLAAKLKGIVGVALAIGELRGTRKLSQNKTETARRGVARALADSPREAERTIARLVLS
jgi:transcriptional regulator